jgi:hypothetical protein
MPRLLAFDEALIQSRLARLPAQARVAFALACAERLQPCAGFLNDPSAVGLVRQILDQTLDATCLSATPPPGLAKLSRALEAAHYLDDDAAAAVAFAVRCHFSGDAREAALAARRAYEARDHEAQQSFPVITASEGAAILAHPGTQREIADQLADLDRLEAAPGDFRAMVTQVRENAARARER